ARFVPQLRVRPSAAASRTDLCRSKIRVIAKHDLGFSDFARRGPLYANVGEPGRQPDQSKEQGGAQLTMKQSAKIPHTFVGIGYTRDRAGLPLEAVRVPVPQPAPDQVLIRVAASSLNPLEYKLAELNFLGRTPPVALGLDLAGVVVAKGSAVSGVAVGDPVAAMADLNGDGGWVAAGAEGHEGGYALAREFLTVRTSEPLTFRDAALLP